MQRTHAAWLAGSGALLILLAIVGKCYLAPRVLRSMVIDSVILKDNSEAFKRWQKTPQPLFQKTYLFHVENPEEVTKGARPILTEKGPYVYDIHRERVDVKYHPEDDTISYFDKSHYVFNRKKSGCRSDEDIVTLLNAPIVGSAITLAAVLPMALDIFNAALPYLFDVKNPFMTGKVKDLLFDGMFVNCSYPSETFPPGPVCDGIRSNAPEMFRRDPPNFYFSMLNHLNATSKKRVRVKRGLENPMDLGRIVEYGNSSRLDAWRENSPCTMFNGTDTTLFHPFIQPNETIPIFQSTACRSMYVKYEHPTDFHGVPALRFIADPNMLASGRDYPPNVCFCKKPEEQDEDSEANSGEENKSGSGAAKKDGDAKDEGGGGGDAKPEDGGGAGAEEADGEARRRRRRDAKPDRDASECLLQGALDITKCMGSPVILTLPHFYLGAKEYLAYPQGLKPDKASHETFLELEPVSGTILRGGKRVQLNMFSTKFSKVNVLSEISEGLFPILWFEEGIELEGDNLAMVSSAHRSMKLLAAAPWVVAAIGVILVLGSMAVYAQVQGMFHRMAMQNRVRGANRSGGEYPLSGPPPGNYGSSPDSGSARWGNSSVESKSSGK